MKVLIVHAHHEPRSFNGAMTRTAQQALVQFGHEVVISDLYAMGFNPVSDRRNFVSVKNADYLKQQIEEIHATAVDGFAADVRAEIEKLEWCDALILQFPMWWFGMPAILKGWVDRVLASGRVYGGGKWYERGAFAGTRAMVSMTVGGGESMYEERGLNPPLDSILRPIQHGVFWFCGFQPLEPFIVWRPARLSDDERRARLADYAAHLAGLFSHSPIRYAGVADCDEAFRDRTPRFMVTWEWTGPDDDPAVNALIPQERRILAEWKRDGILLERAINASETRGWLVIRARDEGAVQALLDVLPLRRWLSVTIDRLGE